jgi:hypothetical protein
MEVTVMLDACCTLNFSATNRAADLLNDLPYRFVIGTRARSEAQWLAAPGSEEREPVDLQPLIEQGLITEARLEHEEETVIFVQLAARMGDGEAEAAALAVYRSYVLATDDRKARRILSGAHPALRLTGTLELLREWQEITRPGNREMAALLRRISERATYRPGPLNPLRPWWAAILGDE